MSLTEALPIAKQIADALEAAHEQGIVTREIAGSSDALSYAWFQWRNRHASRSEETSCRGRPRSLVSGTM